jgi:hypothetical protein
MSSTKLPKAVIVPQNKAIGNSIVLNGLTYCAHRTVNFNVIVFPKNGNMSIEINFKNFSIRPSIQGFFKDCGYIGIDQFLHKNQSSFFIDTDRMLGRFKAVVIDENYTIFGE